MSELGKFIKKKGFRVFSTFIGGTPKEIFERDYKQLKSSDILIAEVSETSYGVGMEIGLSYEIGLKRILLLKKGKYVTKFAQGMPGTYIIEYQDTSGLKKELSKVLEEVLNKKTI